MSGKVRSRVNGIPASAYFVADDDLQREHRLRSLLAEAQQTGAVRRQAVETLRVEYRVTYWERNGKVIVRREEN